MQLKLLFLSRVLLAIIFGAVIDPTLAKAQSLSNLPENQLVLPSETYSIPFYWQGDSIHSKWEPHTAILIPVHLTNCPRQFYMQFDLGSPYSILYKNKLASIQMKYPTSIPSDTTDEKLINFSFEAGKMPISAKKIVVKQFDSSAVNWKDKNSIEIIGTIGADLIEGKVAIIDYPYGKLTIADCIPVKLMPHISLTDFIYSNRSVLFPAKINGKETILYFDTGSSMFELLTDKETCNQLAIPDAELIKFPVKSWDKLLTANTLASNKSIELANTVIPLRSSTYMEGISNIQIEQMSKMGIGGMTGNKLFLEYKLVLDTRNKKFGLIRSL